MFNLDSPIGWLELAGAAFVAGFFWSLGCWVCNKLVNRPPA